MVRPAHLRAAIGTVLVTWPGAVLAEVMDKETAPWSPVRLTATVVVSAVCLVLTGWARRTRGASTCVAIVAAMWLALIWGTATGFDDFFSSDVGPAMHVELGPRSGVYGTLLVLESVAPLLAVFTAARMRPQSSSRISVD